MVRIFSYSQATSALECPVAFDLGYVGQLTDGHALRKRTPHSRLTAGRVWGAAIQTWHASGGSLSLALAAGAEELTANENEIHERGGLVSAEDNAEVWGSVEQALRFYATQHTTIPLVEKEAKLFVTATRGYRLEAYVDGVWKDDAGRTWLYESKFRSTLTDYDQITRSRQLWWYAWAWRKQHGEAPVGAVMEEVLNETPNPVRFNKDGKPSAVQSCTPIEYVDACARFGVEPNERTLEALRAKRWAQRVEVLFTPRGIGLAGRQVRAAANLIGMYDRGVLAPIHNPSNQRCKGCSFKDVCLDPSDAGVVDALFERVPPARERTEARR